MLQVGNSMKKAILILLAALSTGCFGTSKEADMKYDVIDIDSLSYEASEGALKLKYKVLMESLYFSPGINLREEGGKVYLDIVRCRIDDKCAVDFDAEYDDEGASLVTLSTDVSVDDMYVSGAKEETALTVLAK